MTSYELHNLMQDVFDKEILDLYKKGQEEYASNSDAFSNFKEQVEELGLDPKVILWVHAMKHKSGIASYLKGVKSQREDVRGRISDLIVYLFLLRGMIEEEDENELKKKREKGLKERRAEGMRKGIFYTKSEEEEYLATGKWPHELKDLDELEDRGEQKEEKHEEEKPKTDQEKPTLP